MVEEGVRSEQAVGGLWFPAGCGLEAPSPAGWGPLSVPCLAGLSIEQLTTQELASSEQVREQNQGMKEFLTA